VTYRADAIAIAMLKNASKASKALEVGERAGRAIAGAVKGTANLGGGIAKGLGAPEGVGRAAALTAGAGATYVGGRRIKRKIDEAKFRLMYGDPGMYY
jgi:hypothetical protein